jgi:hypothetical protein
MKIRHLMEGAEPKMPGAPGGIQIMTPQQFVAKAGDMPGEEVDEGVRDLGYDAQSLIMKLRRDVEEKRLQPTPQAVLAAARELAGDMEFAPQLLVKQVLGQGMAEGSAADGSVNYTLGHTPDAEYVYSIYRDGKKEGTYHSVDQAKRIVANMKKSAPYIKYKITRSPRSKMAGPKGQLPEQGVAEVSDATLTSYLTKLDKDNLKHRMDPTKRSDTKRMKSGPNFVKAFTKLDNRKQGVAEGDAYMESLAAKLAEKIPKNAPVDVWIKDFEKSNAPQFRGKNLAKRKQMAVAASYAAKNPSKKK